MSQTDLMASVHAQKDRLPEVFGTIDFHALPVRFTTSMADCTSMDKDPGRRAEILARPDLVDLMRVYTLHADPVADAYAALMLNGHRLSALIAMLKDACDKGLDAVPEAPVELKGFIHAMEDVPDWLDLDLAEEGARFERNTQANHTRLVSRGAFLGTYLNKYSALPMALTGSLSDKTARRRIFETSSFTTQTTLPRGMTRYSEGFKSAAMVRMMHSTVRVNLLTRGNKWDAAEYGVPIPQVDQMPAGLFSIYSVSQQVFKSGRTEFTDAERARCEFARYRCFLLGLPEVLLPVTPREIVDIFDARRATMRDAYDEAICAPLIEATLNANLKPDESLRSRVRDAMSVSLGKVYFTQIFRGKPETAKLVHFDITRADRMRNLITVPVVATRLAVHGAAANVPGLRRVSDRILVARMKNHLNRIGSAKFVSDGSTYRPKVAATGRDVTPKG